MQDMNDSIEQLRKAVKTKAPKLDDQTILNGIAKPKQSKPLGRRLTLSGLGVATVVIAALSIGLSKPTPLFSLGNRSNSMEYSAATSQGAGATDKMSVMIPAVNYEYVPGNSLGWMRGLEKVYEVKPSGDPLQLIQTLATRFGIKGEIVQDPWGQSDTHHYFYGDKVKQYELPAVDVYWNGTGSWWVNMYTGASSGPGFEADEYYKSMGLELFKATGLNAELSDLALYKDTGRRVVGYLKVDGKVTPIFWEMDWDQYGNLIYASGNSLELVDRGFASTVSEREAVNRISDWRYSGFGGGMLRYGAMATDVVISDDTNSQLETKNVTVKSAKHDIVELWDKNGNTWLVPGYTFDIEDLWWNPTVFSLVDGLIELPDASSVIPY